jgi:hypothetical protein
MKAPTVLLALALASAFALPRAATPARAAEANPERTVLLTAPANLPPALLGERVHAQVGVRAHVSAPGLVDSALAVSGDPRLRQAAEASVRWWVFAPSPRAGWETVTVPFEAGADAPGLHPDVISMARASEARGDLPTALAAWTGALERTGTSPVAENPWEFREHVLSIVRRMPSRPEPPLVVFAAANRVRASQLRTMARGDHADLVKRFDDAIAGAPWWADLWLWRAGSLAGCGRTAEALRSLKTYRLASADTAGVAFANRLIVRLATSDTVGVCEAVKTWQVVTESPDDRR